MKVQWQGQTLRLRIDEDELAQLLDGHAVGNRSHLPDGGTLEQMLQLGPTTAWQRDGDRVQVTLPQEAVRAHREHLPCREGLTFSLPVTDAAALRLRFDVDVRDSARRRHGAPR